MKYLLAFILLFPLGAFAQGDNSRMQEELKKLAWQVGPTEGRIGDKATIKIPKDYVFLDDKNTSRFLEIAGNPPPKNHFLVAPQSLSWFSVFTFDDTGYVKDDEKIDADALLKTLKEADAEGNEERKRLGLGALYTDGWQVPPHYDSDTKRLEWGMRLRNQAGQYTINYTSRLLGRTGVMKAILVSDVDSLAEDTRQFKAALQQFSFVSGEKYAEFKSGDRVAEFGLAALVLGGAAALATKKGFWGAIVAFFAAFWKIAIAAGVAAIAGLKSLFNRNKS